MTDYARGLEGVIANESALSKVDGAIGELSYLGYHIDQLVEKCSYEEVVYLLQNGRLPNRAELTDFEKRIRGDRELPQGVLDFLKSAPKNASPMDILRTGVSMLGLYDKRVKTGTPDIQENAEIALSLIAKTRFWSPPITVSAKDWNSLLCARTFRKLPISSTSSTAKKRVKSQ